MRHLRPITAILAIAAITVACGGPPAASAGGQSSQGSEASQGAGASEPVASTGGGGGGGGANGSVTYQITGGYTRSGELPWVPLASTFADGTWYLAFTDTTGGGNQDVLAITGAGGSNVVVFGNSDFSIAGGIEPACTFNFTRQDASGAAGSFDCRGVMGIKSDSSLVQVDFKGNFDGHK